MIATVVSVYRYIIFHLTIHPNYNPVIVMLQVWLQCFAINLFCSVSVSKIE